MNIGNIKIEPVAALAPMAGICDRAFREICVEHGASYVIGEMCSAKGLTYKSEKSAELLMTSKEERPAAVQLFGDAPRVIAEAVKIAEQYSPQIIDINMGCPAPKITSGGSGSALMKNLDLAEKIIAAAVESTDIPITVKFRKGWDDNSINAVEMAVRAERAGASAVCVHGRTKVQMYTNPVDWDIIRRVAQEVSIPVIGNGGVDSPEKAKEMYDYTGCDLAMIGQGALGRPWVFGQVKCYLDTGVVPPEPTLEKKMEIFRRHIRKAVQYKGEYTALREGRTHGAFYIREIKDAAALRKQASAMETLDDLERLIEDVLKQGEVSSEK